HWHRPEGALRVSHHVLRPVLPDDLHARQVAVGKLTEGDRLHRVGNTAPPALVAVVPGADGVLGHPLGAEAALALSPILPPPGLPLVRCDLLDGTAHRVSTA